ncbi:MAG: ABC transporter substrate-binding protein [Rhodospirillales bacterium CG15_BIG_FIL_POST_REV_8_21_14_020_66_15]|nr:MAG: ABC transporter substrate-binding protein [Rhodospirillales bacterium CG15_BIG_FIL_POST_REV_8_21_14_020_66_15]
MKRKDFLRAVSGALAALAVSALPAFAADLEGKLVIVTSYPPDTTVTIKKAFEAAHPGVEVEMLKKKTTAGIKFLQETAKNNTSDMFWASAPDAFEVLKADGLLAKYQVKVQGIPEKVGAFPINDPDGYYKGFAASGYGIMWNTRYLKAKKLPVPKTWAELADPVYFGHVGMSAPSRSGTTHLTVETILQGMGWEKGWGLMKSISGNFKTVTERSFGVPDGVNSGQFGLGIVIDFFGLSSQASGFPVDFLYPPITTLVPANIAIVKNAPHPKAAAAFIEFLLSAKGQEVLLDPKIRRLPVNPETYAKAPAGFPNPFKDKSIGAAVKFDLDKSKGRYNVVNSLFDVLVTYRLSDLQDAVKAIHDAKAKAKAKGKSNAEAAKLIAEAEALVAKMPITEEEAGKKDVNAIFKKKRKKADTKITGRQAEVEQQWDKEAKANYTKAKELAKKAAGML